MISLAKTILLSVCLRLVGDYQEYSLTQPDQLIDKIVEDNKDYIPSCLGAMDREIATPTNLLGIKIPVALVHLPPFLDILYEDGDPNNVRGKGMSWDLMNALASHFNFTPVPLVAKQDVVGLKDDKGQWQGALQLLYSTEAELTVLPVTYSEERQKHFEFSMLLGTTSFGILVKRPEYTPKPDALLSPFKKDVWFWIIGSTAAMGPLIYFIIVIRVRLCRGDPTLTRIFPFDQCVWFVYGAMMKQGSTLKPVSDSSRILFATWWLFIMIVTSFYTANLTAFLTFNGLKLPIRNIQDLTNDPSISWVAYSEGALVDIIKNHGKLGILRDLRNEGRGGFTESRSEALRLVDEGTHVYIDDMRILRHIIQEDYKVQQKANPMRPCRFYTAPLATDKDLTFWYGYGFRKGSRYKNIFDRFFRRLSVFGIMDYLNLNATSNLPVCTLPKGFKERQLQTKDLVTTYILAVVGYAFACFSLIVEYFCRRKNSKKTRSREINGESPLSHNTNITVMNIGHSKERAVPTVEWNNSVYPAVVAKKMSNRIHQKNTKNRILEADNDPNLIKGSISNVDVLWDKKSKRLIMDDISKLRGNITVVDGIPYVTFRYKDKAGIRVQKFIISDLM
ncbi:glutamate receptor ionotropic, delta-2-like isoform X1 [Macrobrachium nipponense]|uniref:glutamate receptor ionotropic, delta-2-like isoform X1 n=2 Tax=Macrobrachium nipponense TaxID=159736 RepID=UPI0030C7FA6B